MKEFAGESQPETSSLSFPELTEEEQSLRLHLERKVNSLFYEGGKALGLIRDLRLYRSTHDNFDDYIYQQQC